MGPSASSCTTSAALQVRSPEGWPFLFPAEQPLAKKRMAACYEYTIKYHHGKAVVTEGDVTYANGAVIEYVVDLDKLCHWDLLDDVKEIRSDIKKDIRLSYKDDEGTLISISGDRAIPGLTEQSRAHNIVDIYVESGDGRHEKKLPKALLSDSDSDGDVREDVDSDNNSASNRDDEERLVDVPFINHTSDADDEIE
ncbi:hypothetical protein DsansV1_C07g0071541 [Dioscorea sansibarensis]